jgi:hypothetical protein
MAGSFGEYVRAQCGCSPEAQHFGGAVMRKLTLCFLLFSACLSAQIFGGGGKITVKDGESVVGQTKTLKIIQGGGITTAVSNTGNEISIQIDATVTGGAQQGMWFGAPDSNTTNVALSAADRIYVQSVYVEVPWQVRRLIMNVNAADTLGSLCLYSWGGPSVTTATRVASTTPASLATGYEDRVISETSVTIQPGWYLIGFTGHAGTLGIKRAANSAYYTPVGAQ